MKYEVVVFDPKIPTLREVELDLPPTGQLLGGDFITKSSYLKNAIQGKYELFLFTGFLDKNNNKVFEGHSVKDEKGEVFTVKYSKEWCAFLLYPKEETCKFMVFYPTLEIEIVGHIMLPHADKELFIIP